MPNPMWEWHTAFLLLLFKYSVVYYGRKCLVKFVQKREKEMKAEKALEALKKMSAPTATVRRDGKIVEIPAENLVVGDIVILEEGRTVPADLRLIKNKT